MSNMEKTILEELVYDRVRASVNLCQLVIIERELEESVQRAMVGADMAVDETAGALARRHVDRAWTRIEREWLELREELGTIEDD